MKVAGTKEIRTLLFPKSSARMVDIWHTVGLRGTASNEYVVKDLFVPADHTMLRDKPIDRREQGPLYRFASNQLYSTGFAGVGLGIARGLIDAFLDLPANKVSRGASKPMRENNVVQSQLAQAEAKWRSARAFLHNTVDEICDNIDTRDKMTERQAAMLRLASTWSIQRPATSSTRCTTPPGPSPCSKTIRSSAACAISIPSRNKPRAANSTTNRSGKSCSACHRKTSSKGGTKCQHSRSITTPSRSAISNAPRISIRTSSA